MKSRIEYSSAKILPRCDITDGPTDGRMGVS